MWQRRGEWRIGKDISPPHSNFTSFHKIMEMLLFELCLIYFFTQNPKKKVPSNSIYFALCIDGSSRNVWKHSDLREERKWIGKNLLTLSKIVNKKFLSSLPYTSHPSWNFWEPRKRIKCHTENSDRWSRDEEIWIKNNTMRPHGWVAENLKWLSSRLHDDINTAICN